MVLGGNAVVTNVLSDACFFFVFLLAQEKTVLVVNVDL